MYLSAVPSRRRVPRRLGQLPGMDITSSLALATASPTDASSCWWMYLLGKTTFDNCVTQANQSQVQQVANNAVTYYGAGSPAAVAAQSMATEQAAVIPSDTANTDTYYSLPSNILIPSAGPGTSLTDPSTWPLWAWIAIAAGGVLLAAKVMR